MAVPADGDAGRSEGIDMTVTATSSRRRRGARIAGAAAAFGAAVVLTGLLSSGLGAGDTAASAVVHAAGEPTTAPGEPVAVAARRTNKSNSSDYLKVTLKEAG